MWELGETQVISNQLGTITEGNGSYTPGTIATATRLVSVSYTHLTLPTSDLV